MPFRSIPRRLATGLAIIPFVLAPWAAAVTAADGSPAPSSPGVAPTAAGAVPVLSRDDLDPALSEALAGTLATTFPETSAPGVIVGVATPDGRWVAAIGSRDLGPDGTRSAVPMTADLHHRIGDITTTFTVTALLQAVDQGLVALDERVGDFVLQVPNEDATLAQLATMRSGIADYAGTPAFEERYLDDPMAAWLPRELVDLVRGTAPEFPAGARTARSATNAVLLGMVVEAAGGTPIQEAIQGGILAPLGLTQTSFPTDRTVPEPTAHGYTLRGQKAGAPADATGWSPSATWAAGAMISTVDDLLAWAEALVSGEGLLSPELQAARMAAFDPSIPTDEPGAAYGMGLMLVGGWVGHTGSVPGYSSVLLHHLESGVTLVVLANSDIRAGACPSDVPTLPGGATTGPCEDAAAHVAAALTAALGAPPVDG